MTQQIRTLWRPG